MRLIDADTLWRVFEDTTWWDNSDRGEAQDLLDEAPTIDAVEVVRCKNCKHSQPLYDPDMVWCNIWREEAYNKGFCHMGLGGCCVEAD